MKYSRFALALLAVAALACNLGAVPATLTPHPTTTLSVATLTPSQSVPPTATTQPTLASGNPPNNSTRTVPTAGAGVCASNLPPRLTVGGRGRVTPGDPNALRTQPTRDSTQSQVVGQIPGGESFSVVGGPQCNNGLIWWQVNYNGLMGWTPEGQGATYWLEPVNGGVVPPTGNPNCPPIAPRLVVGGQGRVTPGQPNLIRSGPSKSGTSVVGQIPAGGVFSIIGYPACADNIRFWQVNYNGVTGWTGEGEGSTYWTEPVGTTATSGNCDNISPARVVVGKVGRAAAGDPSSILSLPGSGGFTVIQQIPAGSTFRVIGGPQCNNNTRYWQVDFNGAQGWMAEVQGIYNSYQIDPVSDLTGSCPTSPSPKMVVGSAGQVTPGQPNVIRTGPGKTNTSVSGQIPAGSKFDVLDGPVCGDNLRWWKVNYNGQIGWTADGDNSGIWIQPVPDSMVCPLVSRLVIGSYGRVTPGQPNRVRNAPSMSTGAILGQIPAGNVFSVLDGPRCLGGYRWWQVRYNDLTGWTADGEGTSYWLEPYLPG